jgi:hypothetical protein
MYSQMLIDRYLPHLKPLESEGFYISATSQSGIVLARDLGSDDPPEDAEAGWIQRLLGRGPLYKRSIGAVSK